MPREKGPPALLARRADSFIEQRGLHCFGAVTLRVARAGSDERCRRGCPESTQRERAAERLAFGATCGPAREGVLDGVAE